MSKYTLGFTKERSTPAGNLKETTVGDKRVTFWQKSWSNYNDLREGMELEFDIVTKVNGAYTNHTAYPLKASGVSFGPSRGNPAIAKAMDKKNESIKTFQESKEAGIKLASAMNGAIQLAMSELEGKDKAPLASRIMHWRNWIISNWGSDSDVSSPF